MIDDLLGTAKTDENGRFTLSFDETYYQEICVDRKPDVYFKVLLEGKEIHSTKDKVIWNFDHAEKEITIEIDFASLPSDKDKNRFNISGSVRSGRDRPLSGITVRLFERQVATKPLKRGETESDSNGGFRIEYHPKSDHPHIIVCAFPPGSAPNVKPLATVLKTNASVHEKFDLMIDDNTFRGQSEFDRLHNILEPIMPKAGTELDDNDVAILVAETKLKPKQIKDYERARRLAQDVSESSAARLGR